MTGELSEILEAARRITPPLSAGRGWVVRERGPDRRWIDHPQVRIADARTIARRLRAETAVRMALEGRGLRDDALVARAGVEASRYRADWRRAARRAIRELP